MTLDAQSGSPLGELVGLIGTVKSPFSECSVSCARACPSTHETTLAAASPALEDRRQGFIAVKGSGGDVIFNR